jgi:hypothetical protein
MLSAKRGYSPRAATVALGEGGVQPHYSSFFKKNSAAPSREAAAHTWDPLGVFTESRWTWLSTKAVFKISAAPSREAATHT